MSRNHSFCRWVFNLTLKYLFIFLSLAIQKRVEVKDRERFPDSKPAREQPFRMYNDNKVITVKLTDLEEGWEFDKTKDTQVT